jgi:cytochrome c-type biogenesis protein CcsB
MVTLPFSALNEAFFADAGLFLAGFSALFYVLHFLWPRFSTPAFALAALCGSSLLTSLVMRSMSAQFFALSNMYEAMLVLMIAFILAYLLTCNWFKLPQLGWVVMVMVLLMLFYAGTLDNSINPLQPALRSYWRSIHVPPLLLSYGFFTISFLSALAYLFCDWKAVKGGARMETLSHRFNAQEGTDTPAQKMTGAVLYDEVTYRCILAGFILLTVGVILGAVWANEAWGNYWSWDPKESMSLVTLLGYGVYLHMRINGGHSSRVLSYVAMVGFALVIFTFLGVNMWGFGSLHSYGAIK